MLEPSADDHVSDGSGYKLLQEPLLALLIHKVSGKVFPLVGELDPCICLKDFSDILQLIIRGDLVEFVKLGLKYLLVEWRLF
jgi:hypothetical protein